MMTIVTIATAIKTSLYRCMRLPDERGFTLLDCGAGMFSLPPSFSFPLGQTKFLPSKYYTKYRKYVK